ncbi:hypothetical protein J4226_05795 [Candidatus Pacearchaeota archaeon]|nr:hypothetical protein [Candidatus Pacearchaeota archaeon]
MKRNNFFFTILLLTSLLVTPFTTSAHWIAGYVENALDTTSPDGRTVRLWNEANGQETFGIVGPTGLSSTPNIYMIDCEMLATPCQIGDKLNLTIVNDASGYTAKKTTQVTVTGAGFDMAQNLSINTPPVFINITIEDFLTSPQNEIDLTPATQTQANCFGVVSDYEGATSMQSVLAELFSTSSSFGASDDNNNHYTNSTCGIDTSYGNENQAMINCTFQIEYYADSGNWQCQINTTDNYSSSILTSDTTSINTLLALGVNSPMEFGEMELEEVSPEAEARVTNYGNIQINLTLNGYGQTPLDGKAMECGTTDIPIDYMKFNLTASNSSGLTLQQLETIYQNLTSSPTTHEFNLDSRQNDMENEANKSTYWRVYVPQGISDDCMGNIVFAATQG